MTIADREIEKALRERIAAAYPQDGIIGEEYGEKGGKSGRTWVLDPIDGTKSFTIGRPTFTTLIGVCDDGVPVAGAIDQPIVQDRWIGVAGKSYWNGTVIHSRACDAMADAVSGVGSPSQIGEQAYTALSSASRYMIYQGDAFLYGLLAMGNMDVVVEANMGVYDIMALVPVVQNAGGVITDWDGNALTIGSSSTVLAAGDKGRHAEMVEKLKNCPRPLLMK